MQVSGVTIEELQLQILELRQQLSAVQEEKADLEVLLETTTAHSDHIESEMYDLTQQLRAEIHERERTEAALRRSGHELKTLLSLVRRDNEELEMVIQTTVEHGDTIENLLFDAEEKYRSIFKHAVEGIAQIDLDGIYVSVNQALAQIYGYDEPEDFLAEVVGVHHQPSVGADSRIQFLELLQRTGSVTNYESLVYRRDGSIIWICENACAVCSRSQQVLYYVCTVEDITQRKQAQEALKRSQQLLQQQNAELQMINQRLEAEIEKRHQIERELQHANYELQRLATLDSLTQIPNRRNFESYFEQVWQKALHEGSCIALIVADVDYFKLYNDHFGHQAGDVCLFQIAQGIQRALRRTEDQVSRYGGEEFIILLPNTTLQGALMVGQNIQASMAQLQLAHPKSTVSEYVTMSMGIAAAYPSLFEHRDPYLLLKHGDDALYTAKAQGRNRIAHKPISVMLPGTRALPPGQA